MALRGIFTEIPENDVMGDVVMNTSIAPYLIALQIKVRVVVHRPLQALH
jgi:hypothetical protein